MQILIQCRRIKQLVSKLMWTMLAWVLSTLFFSQAHALGLGELRLKSALGQVLRAEISLIGADAADVDASCVKVKIESTEGVLIAPAQVLIRQVGLQRVLNMTTRVSLNEPALKIVVNASCDIQLHREFLVLLDPPQLFAQNQKDESAQTSSVAAAGDLVKRDLAENLNDQQGASSTSTTGTSLATPRASRKEKRNKEKAGNHELALDEVLTEQNRPERKRQSKQRATNKDVLRLSEETLAPAAQGLKLSEALSSPSEAQNIQSLAEIRQAQIQMAALLRDEKRPVSEVKPDQDSQQILQKLQSEMAQLKKQSAGDKAALEELKNNSYSQNWVFALAVLSLFAFAVIALLVVYVRRLQTQAQSVWWQQTEEKKGIERPKNMEEIVNNVQASYGAELNQENAKLGETKSASAVGLGKTSKLNHSGTQGNNGDALLSHSDQFFQQDIAAPKMPTLEDTNTSVFNFFSTRASSVKVEEISDVTQEAEFWMSVNDPHRAIEILDSQAKLERPDSPLPWLYLLDLYRIINDREKYDELRTRFSAIFNAYIPDFDSTTSSEPQRHVDDMPHLMGKICDVWNSEEIVPFLQSLLIDDREGKRVGFELSVYKDLLMLIAIANEVQHGDAVKTQQTSASSQVVSQASNKPAATPVNSYNPGSGEALVDDEINKGPSYFPPEPASDLGMIEFEVIDFPREENQKNKIKK